MEKRNKKAMNIALISPAYEAYSETFIRAHKYYLKGNIFYYYDGYLPTKLEGGSVINSRIGKIKIRIKKYFQLNPFSGQEQALMSSFKRNSINLIFAEYGITGEVLVSICTKLKLPLIVHFHGYDAARRDILKKYNGYKRIFEKATFIICVSKKMENDLLELGCPKRKLVYNVYGPRNMFFKVEPNFLRPQFIAVGRFVDKKAPYYLILSFKIVLQSYPDAKLIIAGDGPLWNTCKNLINSFELDQQICLPGKVNTDELIKYFENSICFVQHSIEAENGDREGTPLSILEASASGLPIVSTSHAGIPDVVIDKKTGLLVNEHEVRNFADKMLFILENQGLAREMGKKGKENIQKNYSFERHIKVLDELIEKAINSQN